MKHIFLFTALSVGALNMLGQSSKPTPVKVENLPVHALRSINNYAFNSGEKSTYRIHYGVVDAGVATISVEEGNKKFGGRDTYHIVGEGHSSGSFDWFFKVRDKYESYVDKQGIFPYQFKRNCDEGGYMIMQDYFFFQHKRAFKNRKNEGYLAPAFVQDMMSAAFYARTMDFTNTKPGDILTIETLVDDEIYRLKMRYVGKETVSVDAGTFKCLRFAPVVQKGRIFKDPNDLAVWVTDDAHHLPVMAQAKIKVGSIKMELQQFQGVDIWGVKIK